MRRRFTFEPVASSAFSNRISSLLDRVATRSSASSFITLVRVSTSMRCSSHHSSGRKSASSRDSLPGGSPSTAAACYTACPARGPPAGSSPRCRPRAASARSSPRRACLDEQMVDFARSHMALRGRAGGEQLCHARLNAHVEHNEHLVSGLDHRVARQDELTALAEDGDDERARPEPEVLHRAARPASRRPPRTR